MKIKMNTTKDDQYTYSVKLWKILGLYYILNLNTKKICGYNVYHIIIIFIGLPLCVSSALYPLGFYLLMNDMIGIFFNVGGLINFPFCIYKMMKVLYHSKDIMECFDITRLNFLSYQYYDRTLFINRQRRTIHIMYIYIFITVVPFIIWIFYPWVLRSATLTYRNLDGSFSEYPLNVINNVFVSNETYNLYYNVFYVYELLIFFAFSYYNIIFDILMAVWCCGISCQLDVIIEGIQSLGHGCSIMDNLGSGYVGHMENKCDVYYDDLIAIIKDHQKVVKKMKSFLTILWSVMLIQIFVASSSNIIVCFVFSTNSFDTGNESSIMSIKLFIMIPFFSFQLFTTCYFFGTINDKKDLIIFALYSSNWTVMDIKFKKLILRTMKMINANKDKPKYTATKVINMELFTSTMRFSYSTFSMLLKYNKNKQQ